MVANLVTINPLALGGLGARGLGSGKETFRAFVGRLGVEECWNSEASVNQMLSGD